jgi:hypothetical protein
MIDCPGCLAQTERLLALCTTTCFKASKASSELLSPQIRRGIAEEEISCVFCGYRIRAAMCAPPWRLSVRPSIRNLPRNRCFLRKLSSCLASCSRLPCSNPMSVAAIDTSGTGPLHVVVNPALCQSYSEHRETFSGLCV